MTFLGILSDDAVRGIARLAHVGVHTEFPYQPSHVVMSSGDLRLPRTMHPAFFGCYDWHSAVHSHWTILKLLEHAEEMPGREGMLNTLTAHLSKEVLQEELAYFLEPGRASYERPYGWAWIWKLTADLSQSALPGASAWHANIRPLADLLAGRFTDWLTRQVYPCRAGTHGNTAFAMELGLDYAQACGATDFGAALKEAATRLFGRDREFSIRVEPSGNDFLSPTLAELSLMDRVLPPQAWNTWRAAFLPSMEDLCGLQPAAVTDRGDGQGVHLDGLNLSRARHMVLIARRLEDPELANALKAQGQMHLQAGMKHVFTGNFLGEHWLGTFAVLAAQEFANNSTN